MLQQLRRSVILLAWRDTIMDQEMWLIIVHCLKQLMINKDNFNKLVGTVIGSMLLLITIVMGIASLILLVAHCYSAASILGGFSLISAFVGYVFWIEYSYLERILKK